MQSEFPRNLCSIDVSGLRFVLPWKISARLPTDPKPAKMQEKRFYPLGIPAQRTSSVRTLRFMILYENVDQNRTFEIMTEQQLLQYTFKSKVQNPAWFIHWCK